jgi:hypothetical protein
VLQLCKVHDQPPAVTIEEDTHGGHLPIKQTIVFFFATKEKLPSQRWGAERVFRLHPNPGTMADSTICDHCSSCRSFVHAMKLSGYA